ncbi:MAG: TolC family protein [Candidatus Zixiibacteriota bacterium]|nr:MAG: TolC family protein [candidate division Zixibacteria bacterium]
MFKIVGLIAIIGLVQTAATASGQNLYNDPVLGSLITAALENNPGLKAAEKTAEAMDYQVTPTGILPDPMFSVGLSGPIQDSWVGEPMAMPNVTLGITQKIPFPGKLGSMKNAARYMAEGSRRMADNRRFYLIADVKSAYYDLAYWQSALKTVEENIRYIDDLEQVVREKYIVGKGLQTNVLNAQKTRTQLEDHKLMIEQMLETTEQMLARLTGETVYADIRATLPESPLLPKQDLSSLIMLMKGNNPGLKKAETQVLTQQQMTKKAKLDFLPDLSVGAVYGIRHENEMFPMFSADMFTFKIGFSLPIWAGWKQKNRLSSARAGLKAAEYEYNDTRDRLQFMLSKSALAYERNRSRYELYSESLVPQTEGVLESARASYEVGALEFLDVIMAQMDLFNAQLEKQRSLADALKALAEIEMLTAKVEN